MRKYKVAVIGLDGANKDIAKLVGINTELHDFISTIPPYTPPSWVSILTGVNPAKHGIIGWQKVYGDGKVRLFSSKDVMYPRLSELLDAAGMKSILINLPMSYPFSGIRRKDNMIIVSDWAAPEQAIFPQRLQDKYGEYLIGPPHDWAKHVNGDYIKKVKEYTDIRMNLYYDLLEKENWNLYFIVFSEIDWLLHTYPQILKEGDAKSATPILRLIGKFIEETRSIVDFLFVVSDHGFEIINKIFYVNEALAEKGFIKYSKSKAKFVNLIRQALPKKVLDTVISKTNRSASSLSYIAKNADAYVVEPANWGVYLKDKSKADEVANALKKYDEVLDIVKFRMIHEGPYLRNMPDLVVLPKKGVELSHELNRGVSETTYKGDHDIRGVFSAYGDSIREDIVFEKRPRVYDVVPTVLHIFGLPIPGDTDGRVLMEIFEEGSEPYCRKPRYLEQFSGNDKIKNTIKKLKNKIPGGLNGRSQ